MDDAVIVSPRNPPARALGDYREDGYIDFFGQVTSAGGWLFIGWLRDLPEDFDATASVNAIFQRGRFGGEATVCAFDRPDLSGGAHGVVIFVRGPTRPAGLFVGLEIKRPDMPDPWRIQSVQPMQQLSESDLVGRALALLKGGGGALRTQLGSLLRRRPFAGVDTLDQLPAPVELGIDMTVEAPPDGLVVVGWLLDPTDAVACIRARSGVASSPPLEGCWLPVVRQDVVDGFASRFGTLDARCGFISFASRCVTTGEPLYLEVELHSGEVGYKRLPKPTYRGMDAIRRILEPLDLSPDEIPAAYDTVLGPALLAINNARLARPRKFSEVVFGTPNPAPECSVIVPLYGRMDFLTYQLALMSEADMQGHEIIYVLDDPMRKPELLRLAERAWRHFGIPFRVIALHENLGFAPANNIGLQQARGEFVCFLNSDVVPAKHDWLALLIHDLRDDPSLGVVGGLLLFEDGTVQHQGMVYERIPAMGNFPFPLHPNKGRMPAQGRGVIPVEAVTGACMVMHTKLAEQLKGFDECYAIGDFEDADLCRKVATRGLRCAVDHRARLWHLERQSQSTPDNRWRMYVTLLNAWSHARRWTSGCDVAAEQKP